jgi:hypothetical protein
MRQLSQSTDLDTISAYISSPPGSIDLPEHLQRRADAYVLIAAQLIEYPFDTIDKIRNRIKSVYPELTDGTLYTYVRDTKAIYGQLDKVDRSFERILIKNQIGKAIKNCYDNDDMRPVPKLIEQWIKLYRLDRPDVFTESPEEMALKITNNYFIQSNQLKIDDDKTVDLDEWIERAQNELKNERNKG